MSIDRFRKINGNTLKIFACITMLIDHFAAGYIYPVVRDGFYTGSMSAHEITVFFRVLRGIGRNAFPIFCFLLVEGFTHTKSRLRYALSLLLFGIISEPFFDITLYATKDKYDLNIFNVLSANDALINGHCNVYFTLFLGLMVIWIIETIQNQFGRILPISSPYDPENAFVTGQPNFISLFSSIAVTAGACLFAQFIHSDYRWYGIILILIFYLLKDFNYLALIAGYLFIINLNTEQWAFLGFILLAFYSQKRGRKLGILKYLFYAFYPAHLFAIYLLRCIMYG